MKKQKKLLYLVGFFLLGLIVINSILITPIKFGNDTHYHISRIYNITKDGLFTLVYPQNFTTLGQIGVATNIFYPNAIIKILNILILPVFGIITRYKLTLAILISFGALFSFLMLRLGKKFKLNDQSQIVSFALACVWGATACLVISELSVPVAMLGIPFIAFGTSLIEKSNANKKSNLISIISITIGFAITFYSHILTAAIISCYLAIFFIIYVIKNKFSIASLKLTIIAGASCLLTSLITIVPIIVLQKLNSIVPPNINKELFLLWYVNFDFIYGLNNQHLYVLFIIIVIAIVFGSKQVLNISFFVASFLTILGMAVSSWSLYLKNTPFTVFQFPWRFFFVAFPLLCMLVIINSDFKGQYITKSVYLFATLGVLFSAYTVRNNMFPDVNHDGYLKRVTNKTITEYGGKHDPKHDGVYTYIKLGSYYDKLAENNNFWYLMNYVDYVPSELIGIKTVKGQTTLSNFPKGKQVLNHDILLNNKNIIKTTKYVAKTNSIEMQFKTLTSNEKSKLELPVIAYKGLTLDVYLNGQKQPYKINNGLVTLHANISQNKKNTVVISQGIPWWINILSFISYGYFCILIFVFYKLIAMNNRYEKL